MYFCNLFMVLLVLFSLSSLKLIQVTHHPSRCCTGFLNISHGPLSRRVMMISKTRSAHLQEPWDVQLAFLSTRHFQPGTVLVSNLVKIDCNLSEMKPSPQQLMPIWQIILMQQQLIQPTYAEDWAEVGKSVTINKRRKNISKLNPLPIDIAQNWFIL